MRGGEYPTTYLPTYLTLSSSFGGKGGMVVARVADAQVERGIFRHGYGMEWDGMERNEMR